MNFGSIARWTEDFWETYPFWIGFASMAVPGAWFGYLKARHWLRYHDWRTGFPKENLGRCDHCPDRKENQAGS